MDLLQLRALWPGRLLFSKPGAKDLADERGLFELLSHSSAVVGINTSALLEAALLGKPALLPEDEMIIASQRDLPHFAILTDPAHGLLNLSPNITSHVKALRRVLSGNGRAEIRRTAMFVRRFLGATRSKTKISNKLAESVLLAARGGNVAPR
jgi:hypothetical protein